MLKFYYIVGIFCCMGMACQAAPEMRRPCIIVKASECSSRNAKKTEQNVLLKKYGASAVVGCLVGACTAGGCYSLDQYIFFPINWLIWQAIRQEGLNIVGQDLEKHHIKFEKTTASTAAWITDWITYIYLTNRYNFWG